MNCRTIMLAGIGLITPLMAAQAAEQGTMRLPDNLREKPFIDAATLAKLAAKQPITIVKRQGPWTSVEATTKTGWVRTINLSLASGAVKPSGARSRAIFHTGSSGTTATTGIKGMDEEDIKSAQPNYAELDLMGRLGVPADEATANAKQSGLAEHQLDYLKGRSK